MKKILSLCLVLMFCLGTVVNAQEITGVGIGTVPIEYQSKSTFTVVLPDSVSLDSTKTQEFEIYLEDYELNDGDKVKVTPVNDKFTMKAPPSKIKYHVGEDANSYFGFPEFPTYYFEDTNQGGRYWVFKDYILTKENGNYYLYCAPKGEDTQTRFHVYYGVDSNDVSYFEIRRGGKYSEYKDREGITVGKTYDDPYPNAYLSTMFYKYKLTDNEWVKEPSTYMPTDKDSNDIKIIQSTLQIEDGDGTYIQYSKEVKDPVDVLINMSDNYLIDDTPITCTIDGSALSSGNWNGELMFEISLVQ